MKVFKKVENLILKGSEEYVQINDLRERILKLETENIKLVEDYSKKFN